MSIWKKLFGGSTAKQPAEKCEKKTATVTAATEQPVAASKAGPLVLEPDGRLYRYVQGHRRYHHSEKEHKALLEESPEKRYAVFRDLSNGDSDSLPELCSLVYHPSDWVGWIAVANISDDASHVSLEILRDSSQLARCRKDVYMLELSARAMGRTGAVECVLDLLDLFTFTEVKPEGVIFASWREAITCAISEIGAPSTRHLVDALRSQDNMRARCAALALGNIPSKECIDALFTTLGTNDAFLRSYAIQSLSKLRAEVPKRFLDTTMQAQPRQMIDHFRLFGAVGCVEATPILIDKLKDQEIELAQAAADALGGVPSKEATNALLEALHAQDCRVADHAAAALLRHEIESGTSFLLDSLSKSSDKHRRLFAAESLRGSPTPRARNVLCDAMSDSDGEVRQTVIDALGTLRDSTLVVAIAKATEDSFDFARNAACRALGETCAPEATPILVTVLNDTTQPNHVRGAAARSLAKTGGLDASEALVEIVKARQFWVSQEAAIALGEMKFLPAHDALLDLMVDRSQSIRARGAAAEALAALRRSLRQL